MWGGLAPDTARVRLFGGSMALEPTTSVQRASSFFRGDLFLPAFELRREAAESYFAQIERSRARFVVGYASAIFQLATLAAEMRKKVRFDAVFPTAEMMLPEWEEKIREAFNCKILPYYGCGEVHSLAYSKPGIAGYVVPDEHVLIEVMGQTGTQLYGRGRFLLTDLDNYAMPIIRYLNGDIGEIAPAAGASPFTRMEQLDGRYNSLLLTESGDLISGVIGTHVFRSTSSVERYRIIQEARGSIVIQIVPKGSLLDNDRELITGLFKRYLGKGTNIVIENMSALPNLASGKTVFVINRCLDRADSVLVRH
jgi:phenylacetate-CoA ligase